MPIGLPIYAAFRGRDYRRRLHAKGEERKHFRNMDIVGFEESTSGIQLGGDLLCRLYIKVFYTPRSYEVFRLFMQFDAGLILCDDSSIHDSSILYRWDRLPRVRMFLWDYALNVAAPLLPAVAHTIPSALSRRRMTETDFLKKVYKTRKVSDATTN